LSVINESHQDDAASFEEQFLKDLLQSEKFRARVLAAISGALIVYVIILFIFWREEFFDNLGIRPPFLFALLILAILAVRSFVISKKINVIYERHPGFYRYFRYANSFLEISVPTIAILIFGQQLDKASALITPPVLLYSVFIILSILELDFKICFFTGLIASIEYIGVSFYFLLYTSEQSNSVLSSPLIYAGKGIIIFISGGVAGLISLQIKKRIFETYKTINEKNRLEKLFGQQVSREIVEEIIKTKQEITSRRRNVCVMFLDIRDFTRFSEKKSPEEIVKYQNDIFSFMIEIVNRNHGIINQLLGDGFMATFGAPVQYENDCQNAVNTAMEIIKYLKERNLKKEIPATRIGIGIHSGEVVTGNVGTDIRKQYSITGNTVILASRIEQLNKEFNSSILISKEVLEKVKLNGIVPDYLGSVNVKGRTEAVEIFKLA
jgi:adenylate cyclase